MGLTFLMSYPGTDWQIRGGANPISQSKQPANPKAALQEWLRLGDAMVRAGAHIAVMRPEPRQSGLPYTSNLGALFRQTTDAPFYLAQTGAKHRAGEAAIAAKFFEQAGIRTGSVKSTWEGQSEVQLLPGNRVILSYGPRSSKAAVEELREAVVPGARVMEVQTNDTAPFGDATMATLQARNGDCTLLVWAGGLANRSVAELRTFVGTYADVLPIEDPEDAAKLATQSFAAAGTVFVPAGLSTGLRGHLIRRGFPVEEIDLPELLGKGGGGPRALVNELKGLVLAEEGPTYANYRHELDRLVEKYPETPSAT